MLGRCATVNFHFRGQFFAQLQPNDQAIAQELIDAFDLRCWGVVVG